jgi:hypothetical protein
MQQRMVALTNKRAAAHPLSGKDLVPSGKKPRRDDHDVIDAAVAEERPITRAMLLRSASSHTY